MVYKRPKSHDNEHVTGASDAHAIEEPESSRQQIVAAAGCDQNSPLLNFFRSARSAHPELRSVPSKL
jgi:hypothetical protein